MAHPKKFHLVSLSFVLMVVSFLIPLQVNAATSPDLGLANSFVMLTNTYTNTVSGTTLTGDLGYTTGPAMTPTMIGDIHDSDLVYAQAGIDQGLALVELNNQPCSYTFAPGAVDLASNVDFPTGTYLPGVYCISGAASIGGGGTVTLSGIGTFIFRMDGALNSTASSIVAVDDGASACYAWWTPTAATTLGANSTFLGNVIGDAGITIGNNVTWTGRALTFGGTASTDSDTLSIGVCAAQFGAVSVFKEVVNGVGDAVDTDSTTFTVELVNSSGVVVNTGSIADYNDVTALFTDVLVGTYTVREINVTTGYTVVSCLPGSVVVVNGDITNVICTNTLSTPETPDPPDPPGTPETPEILETPETPGLPDTATVTNGINESSLQTVLASVTFVSMILTPVAFYLFKKDSINFSKTTSQS